MGKTIKGKLTVSVICMVIASILLTTVGIVIVAGKRMIQDQTEALQLYADKYAGEINIWIENEKMLADGAANDSKAEYLLPQVIASMLKEKRVTVEVLRTNDKWFGVTYKEDKETVVKAIRELVDAGVYPEKL